MEWVRESSQLFVVSLLVILLANFVANLFILPILLEEKPALRRPLVSILVPARNEEQSIAVCLKSLLGQSYPNYEILVLDDQSEDNTAHIVTSLRGENMRLIAGQAVPPNWIGKSWACQQLADEARGEFLLFTDADTIHAPGALAAVVSWQAKTRADLLTLWTFQITETWGEKLVIPLLYVVAAAYVPHWFLVWCQRSPRLAAALPRDTLRALGAANGQFLFFRRESYDLIGGHRAVHADLVEDVALGREIAARTADGLKLVGCDGTHLVQCRMYRSFGEMWEGFTKNLRPVFEGNSFGFMVAIAFQAIVMVLPFAWLCFRPDWKIVAAIGLILAMRVIAAIRFRSSWSSVILHPVGYIIALTIALNSFRKTSGTGVTWKGRVYQGKR
jgi:chlorobactene glucosyltransferase